MQRISFKNRHIDVVGNLHVPEGFDATRKYTALVLATPGSSVKEQIGAFYAQRLAQRGFVALTFDPSYQGESGGEPRDLENPAVRVEDLSCAVDFLVTQPFVDETRIGLLGICAGGGYAVMAAQTEHRFKALATVVGTDIGAAFRRMLPDVAKTLEEVGLERTAAARGAAPRRDPGLPTAWPRRMSRASPTPRCCKPLPTTGNLRTATRTRPIACCSPATARYWDSTPFTSCQNCSPSRCW